MRNTSAVGLSCRSGRSPVDGVMVAHTAADLPISALANSTYATSMRYLEGFEGFGGDRPRPTSRSSLDRFVRAACGVVGYEPSSAEETVEYAFGVLADVAVELEKKLYEGSATQKDTGLLVRLYTKVGDAVSAAEIIDEFLRRSGGTELEALTEKARI